jgi:hypothetical protein
MKIKECFKRNGPTAGIALSMGLIFWIIFDNVALGVVFALLFGAAYSQTVGKG